MTLIVLVVPSAVKSRLRRPDLRTAVNAVLPTKVVSPAAGVWDRDQSFTRSSTSTTVPWDLLITSRDATWLNQIEVWFRILNLQALRGLSAIRPRQVCKAIDAFTTARISFRDVEDRLKAPEFRTSNGRPFTGASVRDVLDNRFYDGKVVYDEGQSDELVAEGSHEIPQEVKPLWNKCQQAKGLPR